MKQNKTQFYTINPTSGLLHFSLAQRLIKKERGWLPIFQSLFANRLVFIISMMLLIVDATNFWSLYDKVANDNTVLKIGLVLFSILTLDFTALVLGVGLKKKSQGYHVGFHPILASGIAFAIAVFINFNYRFSFARILSPTSLYMTYNKEGEATTQALDASCQAALNNSLIPLAVMLLTFALVFIFSNPRLEELRIVEAKLELLKVEERWIAAVLVFYDESKYRARLQAYENAQLAEAKGFVHSQANRYKSEVRYFLMTQLKDPRSISELSQAPEFSNILKNGAAPKRKEVEEKKTKSNTTKKKG